MSYSVYIVDDSTESESICRSVLGYRNALTASTSYGDDDYPISNAFDHSYFTDFSPSMSLYPTFVTMNFNFASARIVNYFAVISKNAEESALSFTVSVLNASTGLYEEVAGFGSMTNGVPVMSYFGNYMALGVRIRMDYSAKPYIMTMFCGEAIVFPRTLSIGAQPAHLSNIDEVEIFYADEGLNILPSRRLARGYELEGSINYVKMSTINEFWREYTDHVKDVKTLFFMWNDKKPYEIIYGVQVPSRHTKPKYKTSLFSQIDFNIVGWA